MRRTTNQEMNVIVGIVDVMSEGAFIDLGSTRYVPASRCRYSQLCGWYLLRVVLEYALLEAVRVTQHKYLVTIVGSNEQCLSIGANLNANPRSCKIPVRTKKWA
jgi:hypothetical protein